MIQVAYVTQSLEMRLQVIEGEYKVRGLPKFWVERYFGVICTNIGEQECKCAPLCTALLVKL